MTCRMNENFQSCNTLLKFFKRSLSKEMDLMLNFSKTKIYRGKILELIRLL